MATQVAMFLCPSDGAPPPTINTGPTNYAFCSGNGSGGGDAIGANGAFILGLPQWSRHSDRWNEFHGGRRRAVARNRRPLFANYSDPGPHAAKTSDVPVPAGPLTDDAARPQAQGRLPNKGASWCRDGN